MTLMVSESPTYVNALEAVYGAPSQAVFGSAVFYAPQLSDDLEQAALATYHRFVGELWERYGEKAWLGRWKEVYVRKPPTTANIVAELRGITNRDARLSVPLILDNLQEVAQARAALAAAFDDPAVTELAVYNIGDGEALSGLLIASCRAEAGEITCLVFLLD